jgi:hypothetical protein
MIKVENSSTSFGSVSQAVSEEKVVSEMDHPEIRIACDDHIC